MRLLLIGDPHVADRPPSSRTESYRDDILAKLEWCVEYANDKGVDAVVSLGDLFHIKRPDRNSHLLVSRVAEVLGKSNSPVLLEVGNHDTSQDRLDSLPSQPLGTLALHPNINIVIGPHPELPVYFIPYFDLTEDNYEYWAEKFRADGGPDKYPLIIAHQSIFPRAEEPIYDFISAESWSESFNAPYCAYGHIHSRMKAGAFYKIGNTHFCNNGSISRGSLHEETIKRKLAVTLFDDSDPDNPYTSVPIPYKPASEVFRFQELESENLRVERVGAFLESLNSTELSVLTVESVLDAARANESLPSTAVAELEEIISDVVTS